MKNKNDYNKICVECGKPFLGYKIQKRCYECINKKSTFSSRHPTYCFRCGRQSHNLKPYALGTKNEEWLCSFCYRRVVHEGYWNRKYGVKPEPKQGKELKP